MKNSSTSFSIIAFSMSSWTIKSFVVVICTDFVTAIWMNDSHLIVHVIISKGLKLQRLGAFPLTFKDKIISFLWTK